MNIRSFALLASTLVGAAVTPLALRAQESPDVFKLGEIVVVGTRQDPRMNVGGVVIDFERLRLFDLKTLDQAVKLATGVVSTLDAGGRRNETDIFVRGFGRWEVPLMIDGVRVYLPADNRLDFSRFLTGNLSAIQIQKGYASVLDGPGAMGGAINLVTRKPVKALELEASGSLGGRSDVQDWSGYARVGARTERFYVQGSGSYLDRDAWSLSDGYVPTANSLEDGGERLGSASRDWGINAKLGFTPSGTNEYTLNYMRQDGRKNGLLNVYNNPPLPAGSFWRWPWWNVASLSFLSNTQLGRSEYAKLKLYHNTFDNALDGFDDVTFTTQSLARGFHSFYEDHGDGATIELGTTRLPRSTLKGAFHYRNDVHVEWSDNRPTSPANRLIEPRQEQAQHTWSAALENTLNAAPDVDVVVGVSFDRYATDEAQEFNSTTRAIFEYPKGGADSWNVQGAAIWRYRPDGQLHASVSDRARFPVIFELFSTRFGTATPNPDLGPERATNLELGWAATVRGGDRLAAAVFYSDVRDLIQTVVLPNATTQSQNVGDGHFVGFEVSANVRLAPELRVGGSYSFIDRTIRDGLPAASRPANVAPLQPTGVPEHHAFLDLTWQPVEALTVTPSVELASDRWSEKTVAPALAFPYVETGAFTLVDAIGEWTFERNVALALGARNLLDENYQLSWGLPQPGRSFFARLRLAL